MGASEKVYDVVIIGAGPAGLTASIYASRALLDYVTIEQASIGGQTVLTSDIDNYPGLPKTTGFDLADAMKGHAESLGATIVLDNVSSITRNEEDSLFEVTTSSERYVAKAVIAATGATPRHAGFEGEEEFYGRGVSYCGTCDGMFYRGKLVYVIGGGNTALEEAIFLTRFADKVIICVRKDHVRAQASLLQEAEANEKIEFRYLTSITKVEGEQLLTSVTLRNNETGEETIEEHDAGSFGVFVFTGHVPMTELLGDMVELSPTGAVITDERMATKTPGLYCAGDLREKPLRQIVTATADGAIAATAVSAYLGHPVEG